MDEQEPIEMTHSAQLINELDASGLASLKQLAFWSGLHENTVRDYRDGRIRHFGSELRFWNGVICGLLQTYAPAVPPICFRVVGLLLKGTGLHVSHCARPDEIAGPLPVLLRQFAPLTRNLADTMEAAAQILEDGRVTASDDPNIAELESKADMLIARLLGIKHRIAAERSKVRA